MSDDKPDRIHSTVVQQFSHGRRHIVQVETIPSRSLEEHGKRKRHRHRRKRAIKAVFRNLAKTLLPPAQQTQAGQTNKKKTGKAMRKRSRLRPSFLGSTAAKSRLNLASAPALRPQVQAKSSVAAPASAACPAAPAQLSPKKSPSGPPAAKSKKRKETSIGPSFAQLSAGMPGNEEVDPPQRVSSSTPAQRWLDILHSK